MEAHKAKALTIVPLALSLKLAEGTDCPPFFMTYSGKLYSINNPGKDLISIAFLVQSSTKEEERNCTIKKLKSEADDYPPISCAPLSPTIRRSVLAMNS